MKMKIHRETLLMKKKYSKKKMYCSDRTFTGCQYKYNTLSIAVETRGVAS